MRLGRSLYFIPTIHTSVRCIATTQAIIITTPKTYSDADARLFCSNHTINATLTNNSNSAVTIPGE